MWTITHASSPNAPHFPMLPMAGRAFLSTREVQVIGRAVSAIFNVEPATLAWATRGPSTAAFARQIAMYLAHVTLGMTLTEVGRAFGRDRTTVAHACAVVEDARDQCEFDRTMDLAERIVARIVHISDCRLAS